MPQISQKQALTAFELLREQLEWYKKNCAHLASFEKRPKVPSHLMTGNIAAASGMTTSSLKRLEDGGFSVNKWNRAKVEKWIKKLYPMTSSNPGPAGVRWRKLNS